MKFLKDYMFVYRKMRRKFVDAKAMLYIFNDYIILIYVLLYNGYEIRLKKINNRVVLRLKNDLNGDHLTLTNVLTKDHKKNKGLMLTIFDDLIDGETEGNRYFGDKLEIPDELGEEMDNFKTTDLQNIMDRYVDSTKGN